jgi:1-acyl-sn-glycerol-3-phosphate acyltransferase
MQLAQTRAFITWSVGFMGLLRQKIFAPFFWTQFLGAFNDNMFKNALVIVLAFSAANESESGLLVNLASGLFILPFFLFSPLSGQLADKYEKSKLIRLIKLAEIAIMVLAAAGFYTESNFFLLAVLFLMGTHSTFFGPIKYSILPQHLREDQLMEGTGLVEMGTFVAILLGTIAGGVLVECGRGILCGALLATALVGWMTSRTVPEAAPGNPKLQIERNPFRQFGILFRIGRSQHSVWLSILGISWYWFFGATFLAQLPNFVKFTLHGSELVVTLLLGVFTVSMAIGAVLCNKLADSAIELGLIGLGAIGMSIFAFDLRLIDYSTFPSGPLTILGFLGVGGASWRVLLDLAMIGIAGSLFIVPLYALVQHRSAPEHCSQVIAVNNIMNAIFMVASALMTMALFTFGFGPLNGFRPLGTVDIFACVALLNLLVAGYIFSLVPEFVMRFGMWAMARTIYRLRYEGRRQFPTHGPVLLVANHVSFIDWFILSAACQRPIRFVMDHRIFRTPGLNLIFRLGRCIPIAPAKEDPVCKERAFEQIAQALKNGEVVGLFPEGVVTYTGALGPFKTGMERVVAADPVPVVPVAIYGLWGSFFSRKDGPAMRKIPKPSKRLIRVRIGDTLDENSSAAAAEEIIKNMLDELDRTHKDAH